MGAAFGNRSRRKHEKTVKDDEPKRGQNKGDYKSTSNKIGELEHVRAQNALPSIVRLRVPVVNERTKPKE